MTLNPIEAEQICQSAERALRHGSVDLLDNFPGLLRRVIAERLWERRQVTGIGLVELTSLRELITTPPRRGWGVEPARIEAVIRHDAEVLQMFRETTTRAPHRPTKEESSHNVTTNLRGNSRAYTLDRLKREAPALYQQVVDGKLSAHAAAKRAGFRTQPTILDQLRALWRKATPDERQEFERWKEATR